MQRVARVRVFDGTLQFVWGEGIGICGGTFKSSRAASGKSNARSGVAPPGAKITAYGRLLSYYLAAGFAVTLLPAAVFLLL